jgi:hypothetical protein
MDSQPMDGQTDTQDRNRRLPRIFTMAALAFFALPFLTVNCYGDATVSGVQAATEIDLYPNDTSGERELTREEPPNGFALVALVATAAGLALSLGSVRSRRHVVWATALGVIALQGLFLYAFYRTWGGAWPRIGFTGALMLLVAAAWANVERVPRWIWFAAASVAVSMIPGTLMSTEDLPDAPWTSLPVYAGGFIAVALVVGAIAKSARSPEVVSADLDPRPSALRMVVAGIVGTACIAAAIVGATFLMGTMLSGEYGPDGVSSSYAFAFVVLAASIVASAVAWVAGRAIAHGRRRVSFAPMRAEIGV